MCQQKARNLHYLGWPKQTTGCRKEEGKNTDSDLVLVGIGIVKGVSLQIRFLHVNQLDPKRTDSGKNRKAASHDRRSIILMGQVYWREPLCPLHSPVSKSPRQTASARKGEARSTARYLPTQASPKGVAHHTLYGYGSAFFNACTSGHI
jgi:hypothetical protein